MTVNHDITEALPIDLPSAPQALATVSPNILYDVVFNDIGFFSASTPEMPYRRETVQYRKDQQDNSTEPGEQSLTGWWLRSQSSFHLGSGIKFYEPGQDEKLRFRFADSQNVDVWTQGQVTLLPQMTAAAQSITSTGQVECQSIRYSGTNAVLTWDGNNVYKIKEDGTSDTFIASTTIYGICNDGENAYWGQNVSGALTFYKKALTATSATSGTQFYAAASFAASRGIMAWAKERIIGCFNNKIYEMNPNAPTSGSAGGNAHDLSTELVYEHPNANTTFTSVTASGSDIYVSGYNGLQSFIIKLSLSDTSTTYGSIIAIPQINGGVVAAEMPRGELIYSIAYYLGYIVIGTSFGVRVAQVLDNGDLIYGPLFVKTNQPVYGFAFDDDFAWCASGSGTNAGLIRIHLGTQIETLIFPWANDRTITASTAATTGVAFMGNTDKLAFSTAGSSFYIDSVNLSPTGYLTTGFIRYNTLEKKVFKFVTDRAKYTLNSGLDIESLDVNNTATSIAAKVSAAGNSESAMDIAATEFIKLKFTLSRDTSTTTTGTTFFGYQVKALPTTPRQRLIQYPLYCYDTEMDRFNNRIGYEGQAVDKLAAIESLESVGNLVTVEDNRSGETYSGLIEEIAYTGTTPPDRKFSGNGGMLIVTVRKI